MKDTKITKSDFVSGERCAKLLYLSQHASHLQAPKSSLEQKTLAMGQLVTRAARNSFPDGVLIATLNTEQALIETQDAIESGALTLFEAAFCYDDVIVRVDVLTRPSLSAHWDFHEVKATTYRDVSKEQELEYRSDIAVQVWVLRKLDIKLDGIYLTHLNPDCRFPHLQNLFCDVDYSEVVRPVLHNIEQHLSEQRRLLTLASEPETQIGKQCEKPRACPFAPHCWKDVPSPSVFDIPACRQKWNLFESGRVAVDQLDNADFRSTIQQRALACYQDEQRYFDADLIRHELAQWTQPISYLDFESIDPPIPKFPKTRPFQHLPFQFSCHIQQEGTRALQHREFLFDVADDPRPAFVEALLDAVPPQGSIVVYYAPYESTRLKELARDFPQYGTPLLQLRERLVDLMDVIKKGVYYPEFLGSFSIKKVAPAILGDKASYAGLEVSDGVQAMMAFERLVALPSKASEREALRDAMLEYCKQDTLLMVHLHRWLEGQLH